MISFRFNRPRSRLVLVGCAVAGLPADAQTVVPNTEPIELSEFTVSASPFARTADELHQAVSVLAGAKLDTRRAGTLGETLAGQPGVSATSFGPGASRPIIRGLDGERIRVLTNGLGTIDASGASPDHAVSIDPALVERIEVVRGPAALLYGSSAAGGVVNVIEDHVPAEQPSAALEGTLDLHYGTAADERGGSVLLRGAAGNLGWQTTHARRRAGDVDIPGSAEIDPHEDEEPGTLENSAVKTNASSAGLAWFWDGGRAGFAVSGFDTRYGVPGHDHHEEEGEPGEGEEEEEEAAVQIDLDQRRLDFAADITEPFGPFRSGRLRIGYADYEHVELEGDEIGTRFDSDGFEARMDLLHRPIGALEGAVGLHLQRVKFAAAGEEAFLPPTRTRDFAVFAVEEIVQSNVRWQAGARFEDHDVTVLDDSADDRGKKAVSGSLGALWTLAPEWTLAVSLSRTERSPTAQEWYANGPHAATRAFEIGNPDLGKEKSSGIDVSLRRRSGAVTGAVSFFATDYDRFIFGDPTGEVDDGLDVYRFVATDARFRGAEIEATWHLHETKAHSLDLTLSGDFVRATNETDHTDLPRIPPVHAGMALLYRGPQWSAGFDVRRAFSQDDVAPLESRSDGYTLVAAHVGYTVPLSEGALEFYLRGENLGDTEARPHTSFLKDVAPLPGRNIIAGARWEF